jgi:hypothetical protein
MSITELTSTTLQVIMNVLDELCHMAGVVNEIVTAWYCSTWGQRVNILAADFFKVTELVEAAIYWNHIHAQQLACNIP